MTERSPAEQSPTQLLLIRHGETDWSLAGRHTGLTDVPLTARGRSDAVALGVRLGAEGEPDSVVVSPLSRALDTCGLAGLGDAMRVLDDLHEWDYGEYEGLTTAEIRTTRPGWSLWRDGCPSGETAAEVGARADRVIGTLRGDASARRVIVFAHGHILRVLAARWLGLAPENGRSFALSPATLSVLGWEHENEVLDRWNA